MRASVRHGASDGVAVRVKHSRQLVLTRRGLPQNVVECVCERNQFRNLDAFVDAAYKITKKYLVIEVPVNRSIPPPNERWDGHYHYFSNQSMRDLFSNKFEVISIQEGVQSPAMLVTLKKV